MSPRMPRRHAHTLHRLRLRQAWCSLGLCLLALGCGALALALHVLRAEPERVRGLQGFWVAEQPQARAAVPRHALDLPVEAPAWAGAALPLPPAVEPPALPVAPEVELPEPLPLLAHEWAPELEPDTEPFPLPRPQSKPAPPALVRRAAVAPAAVAGGPASSAGSEAAITTPPAYLKAPKPPYPAALRQSRIEGSVKLRISLDARGRPQQVEVVDGSGHAAFDTTARLWVLEHWLFTPARRGAQAVPGTVVTRVHFVLR